MKHTIALDNTTIFNAAPKKNIFSKLITNLLLLRKKRQTLKQLSNLSDSLLDDIGIERYELAEAVKTRSNYAKLIARKTDQASDLVRLKIAA